MDFSYENLFLSYKKLKQKANEKNFGKIDDLNIQIEILKIFENFGFITLKNNNYLFFEKGKSIGEINFHFYYKNYKKLDFLLCDDNKTKFLIHFILFNVHIYLTPNKLATLIKKLIDIEIYEQMGFLDVQILDAHNILLNCGLIVKDFTTQNQLIDDNGTIVSIKDSWYYKNERVKNMYGVDTAQDYLPKIVMTRCLDRIY